MTVDIRKKISDALLYLYAKETYIGIFAKLTRIVIVNTDKKIAWTDGRSIYLSRHAVTSYTVRDVAFLVAHEAMHIIMFHVTRMKTLLKKYPHIIINVAADALVHEIIRNLITDNFKEKIVTCDKLSSEVLVKRCKELASLEELVELISSSSTNFVNMDDALMGDLNHDSDYNGSNYDGEVVNEGDES
ncbi:MAG: hypothetical protein QXW44_06190, partial [Pyrobaculum sp.]